MVMGKGKDTRKTNSHAHATSLYLNFANKHSAAAVLYPKFSDTSKPASKQSSRNSEAYHRASSKQTGQIIKDTLESRKWAQNWKEWHNLGNQFTKERVYSKNSRIEETATETSAVQIIKSYSDFTHSTAESRG